MNIILDLDQKEVEDIIYMIKGMPSQPSFLASIEAQLAAHLVEPVEKAPVVKEVPVVEEAPVATP
jgi:hypothetical protein